jgi:hypothetical protein
VAAVCLQPLVWAGVGRRYPWALLGLEGQARAAWGVVALMLLAGGVPAARWLAERPAAVARWAAALLLACPVAAAGYDVLASRHFARFGYGSPVPLLALDGLVLAALVLWLRSRRSPGSGAALAAAGAAAHRLLAAYAFPLDERRSDMLPAILRAVDVWRAGAAPYADIPPPGLKYLPGTWLAHAPAVWLGIDPRIPGALLLAAVGIGLALALRKSPPAGPGSLAEPLTMLVLLNPYHAFRQDLYFDAFLALTAAIFFLGAREADRWPAVAGRSILVGLAACTRQWAWIYGPFALLAVSLRAGRLRGMRLAAGAALALAAGGLGTAPFLLQDPEAFRRGVFAFSGVVSSEVCLGLSGLAAGLGIAGLLPFAQAAICLGSFLSGLTASIRGLASAESLLAAAWFTWLAVVLLNPFLENYFYLSPGFAAAALAVSRRV